MERKPELRSVKFIRRIMIIIGFWPGETPKEQFLINCVLIYTLSTFTFAVVTVVRDLIMSIDDFDEAIIVGTNVMLVTIVAMKMIIFLIYRSAVRDLVQFARNNIWEVPYNTSEMKIFMDCEKKALIFSYAIFAVIQVTACLFFLAYLIECWNLPDGERMLPFRMWTDLPVTTSPYFEVITICQILTTIHINFGICCFDTFLFVLNIHCAGQFKMLQNKIKSICGEGYKDDGKYRGTRNLTLKHYEIFKECVQKHRFLIAYNEKIEYVYRYLILEQMVLSSIEICLFEVALLTGNVIFARGVTFVGDIIACFIKLLLFTMTCDSIIKESGEVANAAYKIRLYNFNYDEIGKKLRQGIIIMMMRAHRPCCQTVGGFFPMDLNAFSMVLSSTMTYFTLLMAMRENN